MGHRLQEPTDYLLKLGFSEKEITKMYQELGQEVAVVNEKVITRTESAQRPSPNSVAEIRLAMEERSYLSTGDGMPLTVVDLGDIKEILALAKKGKLPRLNKKGD